MNTILIVDDNIESRMVLASRLTGEYNIVFADNGVQAIDIINNSSIVCILMNFNVPYLSGFDVMEFMKSRKMNEYIPVILICSDSDKKYIRAGYESGIADMIHRPFDNIILKKRIGNVIRLYMQKKQLMENKYNMEKALLKEKEALKSKTSFLINMSHDIRTPMLTVVGMAELAKSNLADKTKVAIYLDRLTTASEHLIHLINDILDMSRIENNKLIIHKEECVFTELVRDVLVIVQNQAKMKGVTLEVNINDIEHDNLLTDSIRIKQALVNVIGNSLNNMNNGDYMSLDISEGKSILENCGRFYFRMIKSGTDEADRFSMDIYSNIDRENIPMAIAKYIIDKTGGSIHYTLLDNNMLQIDVDMNLEIGIEKQQSNIHNDEMKAMVTDDVSDCNEAAHITYPGKKVLIVDDNAVNRMIACDMMEDLEIEAVEAESGKQAVSIIRNSEEGEYDAIFMDLQMPVTDGYTASMMIRESGSYYVKNIPIVAMSAETYDEKRFDECGMNYYLLKPTEFGALCDILRKIFER